MFLERERMQVPGAIGRDHGGRSVLEAADDLPSGRCSSAVFAFVPEIATVFWRRWIRGECGAAHLTRDVSRVVRGVARRGTRLSSVSRQGVTARGTT